MGGNIILDKDLEKMAIEEKRRKEEEEEKAELEAIKAAEAEEAILNQSVEIQEDEEIKNDTTAVTLDITNEEVVAKNEEIEILTDQLAQERSKLHDS